jgi:hypothetical protein
MVFSRRLIVQSTFVVSHAVADEVDDSSIEVELVDELEGNNTMDQSYRTLLD